MSILSHQGFCDCSSRCSILHLQAAEQHARHVLPCPISRRRHSCVSHLAACGHPRAFSGSRLEASDVCYPVSCGHVRKPYLAPHVTPQQNSSSLAAAEHGPDSSGTRAPSCEGSSQKQAHSIRSATSNNSSHSGAGAAKGQGAEELLGVSIQQQGSRDDDIAGVGSSADHVGPDASAGGTNQGTMGESPHGKSMVRVHSISSSASRSWLLDAFRWWLSMPPPQRAWAAAAAVAAVAAVSHTLLLAAIVVERAAVGMLVAVEEMVVQLGFRLAAAVFIAGLLVLLAGGTAAVVGPGLKFREPSSTNKRSSNTDRNRKN